MTILEGDITSAKNMALWFGMTGRSCRWEKKSLLEAREKILTQTEEIKVLYAYLRQANVQIAALEVSRSSSINEILRSIDEHVTQHITETQRMLRKVIGYSSGGFALATALIVYFMKK
ncbi:Uncharacterized protein Rs2_21514 [Raphanus sativus]|nr:Uncharacterized protein Rs2_21514 [Raphanus sativus]